MNAMERLDRCDLCASILMFSKKELGGELNILGR
jgi:hypothetical protein